MRTGDFKFMRNINEQVVLNLIRKHEIISSSDLVRITGMRPSTIFNILKEMSSKNLVINLGKGSSTEKGGKKPFLWKINGDFSFVIGIDFELTELTAVILDLTGKKICQFNHQFERFTSFYGFVEQVKNVIDKILTEAHLTEQQILGLGISIPGITNVDEGLLIKTDLFTEQNLNYLGVFSECFNFPTRIENNANATAIGAKWLGAAKGCKNFMVVLTEFDKNVGGMGIGIVIDEYVYYGHNHAAGEVHTPIFNLEGILPFFRHDLCKSEILCKYDSHPEQITTEILVDAAKNGDVLALKVFERLGNQIGRKIFSHIALLNPEILIVGGNIANLDKIITEPIKKVIEIETLPYIHQNLQIKTTFFGPSAVAIGAAAVILNEFFKVPVVSRHSGNSQFTNITNEN